MQVVGVIGLVIKRFFVMRRDCRGTSGIVPLRDIRRNRLYQPSHDDFSLSDGIVGARYPKCPYGIFGATGCINPHMIIFRYPTGL